MTYKGALIGLAADISMEMLHVRREWQDIFQVMTDKGLQLRLPYPARITFKVEGVIRSFQDKRRFKEYTYTKSALQNMLK